MLAGVWCLWSEWWWFGGVLWGFVSCRLRGCALDFVPAGDRLAWIWLWTAPDWRVFFL